MAEEAVSPARERSAQPQEQVINDQSLPMDLDEPEQDQENQENVGEIPPDFLRFIQAQARSQGTKRIKAGQSSSTQRPDAIALCSPYRLDADEGGDYQLDVDDNVDGVDADDAARKNDLSIILQAIAEATEPNPELLVPPIPTLQSIHDTLQEVLSELGPIGCIEYLKQLVALKRNDKKFKAIKKKDDKGKGKGKGKETDVDDSQEKDRIFLNLFEMITDFLERVKQESNLQDGTCYRRKSEKMERLEKMLKWRRGVLTNEGEKSATAIVGELAFSPTVSLRGCE